MVKKIKYGKILLVIFLTGLIWCWADLALDEKLPVSSAKISVAKSADPNLWVSFNDDNESSVSIEEVVLKGSAAKIAEVRRKLNDGSLVIEFFLDPKREAMTGPGRHSLDVLTFLRRADRIRQLGLTVESCEPAKLSVNVVGLVKRALDVKCLDEDQNPVEVAAVEPAQVDIFVPEDWLGGAKVQLTRREIKQARSSAIEKTPYIELAGTTREASTAVKITTLPEGDRLSDYTITTATLGFSLSANLQSKYKVVVTNLNEVIRAITIRATPDAKRAYEKMRYQVILEIDDSDKDAKPTEPPRRELVYNFPDEYVRRDEIRLNQQPVTAQFKLIPLPSAEKAP